MEPVNEGSCFPDSPDLGAAGDPDGRVCGLVPGACGDVLGLGEGDSARAAVPMMPSVTTAAADVAARDAMMRFRMFCLHVVLSAEAEAGGCT
jgi:hypothetical protein